MPIGRGKEPESKPGGKIAPETMALVGQSRELGQNRLLEAMRQKGATERGKIQAGAQVRSTQIGAESRQAVAAMQEKEADRRAAERVEGEELDRRFNLKLQQISNQSIAEREQTQRDHEKAIWGEKLDLVEGFTEKAQAQERFNKRLEAKMSQMRTKMVQNLGTRMIDTEEGMQKWRVKTHQTVEQYGKDRGSYEILRDEVAGRVTLLDSPLASRSFDAEIVKAQLPQLTANLLTGGGKSKIEDMFIREELKAYDFVTGQAVINGLMDGLNREIKKLSGEKPLTEKNLGFSFREVWGVKTYEEVRTKAGEKVAEMKRKVNKLSNMKQVLRNVADSKRPMKNGMPLGSYLSQPLGVYIGEGVGKQFGEIEALVGDNLAAMKDMLNDPAYFDYSTLFSPEDIEATKNSYEKKMMMDLMDIWGED